MRRRTGAVIEGYGWGRRGRILCRSFLRACEAGRQRPGADFGREF